MKNRFFIIQSKGGVGKSYISKILTLLASMNQAITYFIDIDNASASLTKFAKAILSKKDKYVRTSSYNLLGSDRKIDRTRFDIFISELEQLPEFVCDFGAASSEQMLYYLQEERNVIGILKELDIRILFVVAGGGSIKECVEFFNLAKDIDGIGEITSMVANEYFGTIDGKSVKEYTNAPIQLKRLHNDPTSQAQIEWEALMNNGFVFDDIDKMSIIRKSRIMNYLNNLNTQFASL